MICLLETVYINILILNIHRRLVLKKMKWKDTIKVLVLHIPTCYLIFIMPIFLKFIV